MKLYIFGNGNTSFEDFLKYYVQFFNTLNYDKNLSFILCDFRGIDTLVMEYLKCKTPNVSILHIAERPRYCPGKYKTKVSQWVFIGGFESDEERDNAAIETCTHFLAVDFNSNAKRVSGTTKNIERCLKEGKTRVGENPNYLK